MRRVPPPRTRESRAAASRAIPEHKTSAATRATECERRLTMKYPALEYVLSFAAAAAAASLSLLLSFSLFLPVEEEDEEGGGGASCGAGPSVHSFARSFVFVTVFSYSTQYTMGVTQLVRSCIRPTPTRGFITLDAWLASAVSDSGRERCLFKPLSSSEGGS